MQNGTRAAIIMTNQSKWLISAYAIFFCGGVLVPLDYKLTAAEQLKLLAHSKAEFLVVEYHLWRAITQAEDFSICARRVVLVTEAPAEPIWQARSAGKNFATRAQPVFVPRDAQGCGVHRVFVGHGRKAEGLRADARKLSRAVRGAHVALSFLAGRALSEHPADEPRDRFHGADLSGRSPAAATVVHLRTLRPEYIREAFTKYKITYMSLVPLVLKNLERGLRQRFAELPPANGEMLNALIGDQSRAHATAAAI